MNRVVAIIMLFAICPYAYCQTNQTSKEVKIHFDQSRSAVNLDLLNNRESITQLADLIDSLNRDTLSTITRVEIDSHTSPEGGSFHNIELSKCRTGSIYEYLKNRLSLPDSIITKKHSGTDWVRFRKLVEESTMKHKDEVLRIVDNIPEETWGKIDPDDMWLSLVDSRIRHLMDLRGGVPYQYIHDNIFPSLRRGSVVIIYFVTEQPKIIEEEEVVKLEAPELEPLEVVQIPEQPQPPIEEDRIPFTVKSNLLQLGVSIFNVGVEFGIGEMFSIDLPILYSPYTTHKHWRLRALMFQPEFRYWLKEPFAGHFFGTHAHVGYFNISADKWDRYQNRPEDPLWGFGVSYGYALNIRKRLHLEFNIGFGYANIKYDTYYNIDNGALYETDQQRNYWGITRAGVSLGYMFNLKK